MQLITQVSGEIYGNYIGVVPYITTISAEIHREDYINLSGFIALTQNLSRAEFTEALTTPYYFGLTNQFNNRMITLEINYE